MAHVTELEVDVASHFQSLQTSCADVQPQRYAITLDGRDVARVDLSCTTGFRAPAPRFKARPFRVSPGVHHVGIRELPTGRAAQRAFRFPVLRPAYDDDGRQARSFFVANRLLIDAGPDGLEIGEPQVFDVGL